MKRLSVKEMLEIFQTHDLALKGKDFFGFRFLQPDKRILEIYMNEKLNVTMLLQEEDKLLEIDHVLDKAELDMILDYYGVVPIRSLKEIELDFDWKQLLHVYRDRRIVTPRALIKHLERRASQYIE